MRTLYEKKNRLTDPAEKTRIYLLLFIFLLAFIIRISGIGRHPAVYHPAGQYHSALLARSFYLNTDENKDDIARIPSVFFRNSREKIDLRINEKFIYQMYRIAGKEDLAIPGMMSVLYWLIGGVILYKIVFLLSGSAGAMISVIFYLFFPFGINISQSIQPESLLNMFFLWAVLQIIKHFRSETGDYFYSAAFLSGFAVLIKITIIFPLAGILIFSGINKYGLKKYIFNRRTVWFYTIFFSIGTSFYIYNIFWNKTMQAAAASMVSPELLITSFFWMGWLTQIAKVTGVVPFLAGIFLYFTIRKKEVKFIIAGLFAGYIIYALIFSYMSATNDYYQLALFPIIALMLGQAGSLIEKGKKVQGPQRGKKIKFVLVFSLLAAGVVFSLYHQYKFMKSDHEMNLYSPAYFLVGEQGSYYPNNIPGKNIWGDAFEAGELTGHGINNILLSGSCGNAVMYYGKLFGRAWPTEADFDLKQLKGEAIPTAKELFNSEFALLKPKFFIITDLVSWQKQPGLQKFLKENFKMFAEEKRFIIFNLRKKFL